MRDTRERLGRLTISLHWTVGIAVIGMLVLGFYMATTRTRSLWDPHKSIGVILFLVVLLRVLWRIRNGWPPALGVRRRIEQNLARVVQWTLLVVTVLMPISGMVSSVAGGHELAVFGLEFIAENPDPSGKLRVLPYSKFAHEVFQDIHATGGWILACAIPLHVSGALKHHLFDRDGTLRRMMGRSAE